jgi:hypothetical protein
MEQETGVPITNTSFFAAMQEVEPKDLLIDEESGLTDEDAKVVHLSKHPGWEVLKERMLSDIKSLELNGKLKPGETMEVYGARRIAEDMVIGYIKQYLDYVESVTNYAKEQQKRQSSQGGEN